MVKSKDFTIALKIMSGTFPPPRAHTPTAHGQDLGHTYYVGEQILSF